MALNWQLDEEVETHMKAEREEEAKNPPPPEPDSGPSTPSVTVEKEEPVKAEPKPEVKAEEPKKERPRNPDGTFAKTDAEVKAEKEAKAPEKAPEKPQDQHEKMVSLSALHEERQRRKEMQSKVDGMERRFAELIEKMNKPAPAPVPDPAQDFPAHVTHHFNQFAQKTEELGKEVQSIKSMEQQRENEARFLSAYQQSAAEFTASQKDFPQAYSHWLQSRLEELTDAGYSKEQAMAIRTAEEKGLVGKAFQDGVNPAERLFAVAKRRGYTSHSAEPAPQTQHVVSDAEKLKTIAAGQRATPALGGGGMKPKLTLQGIAALSDDEFNALDWEKTMRELAP